MTKGTLQLTTFRIGELPIAGQGLRLGVTRRPPRGVAKSRWVAEGLFDVWLPTLAPSEELLRRFQKRVAADPRQFGKLAAAYERELLGAADRRQLVEFLALLATRTPIAIGCFCADESLCHRSVLARVVRAHAPAG